MADGRRVLPAHRHAYLWMMWQMRFHLPEYEGLYPVWAWLKPKPDLRRAGLLAKGTPAVLLKLSVHEDRILLSDFMGWHYAINLWYLALTETEQRQWENEWCRQPDAAARLKNSWGRMFDLTAMYHSPLFDGPNQTVQACLEYIEVDEVEDCRLFTAR